jgi:hypothetical protein
MKNLKSKIAMASLLGAVSVPAMAWDLAAVTTAFNDAASKLDTVSGLLIGVVAVLVGLTILLALMKKA